MARHFQHATVKDRQMQGTDMELVRNRGVPPVFFGMTILEARDAMQTWGAMRETSKTPGGTLRLHVRDDAYARDVYVNFEGEDRVSSLEIWRPGDPLQVVRFLDVDLFGPSADEVIGLLRQRGHAVDTSDAHFPICDEIALGFNRSGGHDADENGLSWYFHSVLIAPPGYYGAISK
jgi:hypothetical protein